jgi:glycerol uptake facilitator-like aquaporin
VVTGLPHDFFSDFQSICFGWGFALMIGILVSGGVSGGHLNPAVTLAMAALKKCSWIQVNKLT